MMLIAGLICSVANGITFPLNLLIFDEVVNGFVSSNPGTTALDTMNKQLKWYLLLAFSTLVIGFVQMFCFSLSAKRQSRRIRLKLFKVTPLLFHIHNHLID